MTDADKKLDRLLRGAYPAVEVSPDFKLRLWRKLMLKPAGSPWLVPVPALALAAVVGLLAALSSVPSARPSVLLEQWALFGNAPRDTLAGAVLTTMEGGAR